MTKTQKKLIEYITREIVYNITRENIDVQEAISRFYYSDVCEKLNDIQTGLYIESPAYVYTLFMDELSEGKIIQKEV